MKFGDKLKAIHSFGSKMNHNQVLGSKMKSLVIKHMIDQYVDKKDENPKSFLEKR